MSAEQAAPETMERLHRQNARKVFDGLPDGDLPDHPWVEDYEEVSFGDSGRVYVVRFDLANLPTHVLDNDRYDLLSVWVDTVPSRFWRKIIGERACRVFGKGRDGISVMLRVRDQ